MFSPSRLNLVRAFALFLALAVIPVFSACNKPRKVLLNKRQKKKIDDSISDAEPKMKKMLNLQFDDRVRLVGINLKQSKVKPGGFFTIEYAWLVTGVVDNTDWKIFVHVDGNGKRFGADHHGVGGLYPMKKWPKGKYVTYEQKVTIPKEAKAANAGIWIGVFDEQAHKAGRKVRMKVANDPKTLKFRMDSDGRVEIGNIEITGKKGQASNMTVPQYAISKTTQPVVIDGVLNDPAWRSARNTRMFMSGQGRPLPGRNATYAKLSWDETYLYAGFVAKDPDIFSEFKGRDSTLWKQDCIEVYLDPGVTHRDYVELQISPTGEIFDAHFTSRRRPEWPKAASRLTLAGMKVGIKTQGSINASGDGVKDKQWTLEIAIPWTDIPTVTGPPKDGEAWGMNFYRVDVRSGGKGKMHGHWSPAGNDFHNTNRFATVRFSSKPKTTQRPASRGSQPRMPQGTPGGVAPSKPFAVPVPNPAMLKKTKPSSTVKGGNPTPVRVVPTRTPKNLVPKTAKPKPAAAPKVR